MDKAPVPTRKISILLADDHTIFRQGLATILASYGGVEVLGEVPNDAEALRLVDELEPDVVIMQVQMPFERAKESLERMRALPHPPKVIVVTMFEDPRYVRSLMELGASAYLVKTSSSEHLVAAVRAAVFDPRAKNAVVGMPLAMLEESRDGVEGVLSARELELLLLGGPRALQSPDSREHLPSRGHGKAPPGQHLPEDGRLLPHRGLKGGAPEGLDHHRGGHAVVRPAAHLGLALGLTRDQLLSLVHEREEVLHGRVLYPVGAIAHADPRSHAVRVEHLHAAHDAA